MSERNTVYFPYEKGPFFYVRATIATRDMDWWLAKGALRDVDEAVKKGKALTKTPVRKTVKNVKNTSR
jgi:hypothetical protein